MEQETRVIQRASAMHLDIEDLYGLVGRLLRAPGAVKLLDEALDEIERGRDDMERQMRQSS